MNEKTMKLSAKADVDAARGILSEAAVLLSEDNVDGETVLFLLDRAQSAISKCRAAVGRQVEAERGEGT